MRDRWSTITRLLPWYVRIAEVDRDVGGDGEVGMPAASARCSGDYAVLASTSSRDWLSLIAQDPLRRPVESAISLARLTSLVPSRVHGCASVQKWSGRQRCPGGQGGQHGSAIRRGTSLDLPTTPSSFRPNGVSGDPRLSSLRGLGLQLGFRFQGVQR